MSAQRSSTQGVSSMCDYLLASLQMEMNCSSITQRPTPKETEAVAHLQVQPAYTAYCWVYRTHDMMCIRTSHCSLLPVLAAIAGVEDVSHA